MDKQSKITRIKEILDKWGSVSIYDLQHESSPLVNSIGENIVQLAERFKSNYVETIVYVDDIEHSEIDVYYAELPDDVINEIFEILVDYETDCEKTFERTKN